MVQLKDSTKVDFIAFSLDSPHVLSKLINEIKFSYQQFADGKVSASKFKVKSYPTHFIVDRNGIIRYEASGYSPFSINDLSKRIDALLRN